MTFGGLIVLVLLGSLVYGVYQFARAGDKSTDAALTAAYIVAYPLLAYLVWINRPVPLWVLLPVMTAGLPWIVAGIYLNEIVKDPGLARESQFVGFPYRFWIWGGVLSVLAGSVFE